MLNVDQPEPGYSTLLRYDGEINTELCRGLTLAVHNQMSYTESDLLTRKRITHVITECLLNLSHHAEMDIQSNLGGGKHVHILIVANNAGYWIRTVNMVSNKKVNFLTTRLKKINGMTPEELYEWYLMQLQTGEYTNKGTAGLGFIDIARKSGHALGFDFRQVNEHYSEFSFEIRIDKPSK
jgi:hypothetical protein